MQNLNRFAKATLASIIFMCCCLGNANADVRSDLAVQNLPLQRAFIMSIPGQGEAMSSARVHTLDNREEYSFTANFSGYTTSFNTFKGMKFVVTDIEYVVKTGDAGTNHFTIELGDALTNKESVVVYANSFAVSQYIPVRERLNAPIVIPEMTKVSFVQRGALFMDVYLRGYLIDDGMGFNFSPDVD